MMGNKISALCEYSDIVVMFDLLGVKSFYSTHAFQWCNIRAAVRHQYLVHSLSNDASSGDDTESDDGDNVVDIHEDVSDAVERMMKTGDDNKELDMLKVCNQRDMDLQQPLQTVIIKDATTRTRKIITAQQFEDYRHRGKTLALCPFYNYISKFKRVRKRKQSYGERKAHRRASNARLPFSPQHPLFTTHEHQCIINIYAMQDKCVHTVHIAMTHVFHHDFMLSETLIQFTASTHYVTLWRSNSGAKLWFRFWPEEHLQGLQSLNDLSRLDGNARPTHSQYTWPHCSSHGTRTPEKHYTQHETNSVNTYSFSNNLAHHIGTNKHITEQGSSNADYRLKINILQKCGTNNKVTKIYIYFVAVIIFTWTDVVYVFCMIRIILSLVTMKHTNGYSQAMTSVRE